MAQDKDARRAFLGFIKSGTESSFCFDIIFTDNIIAIDLKVNQLLRGNLEQLSLASSTCIPNRSATQQAVVNLPAPRAPFNRTENSSL